VPASCGFGTTTRNQNQKGATMTYYIKFDHPQRCDRFCEKGRYSPGNHVHCSGCGYPLTLVEGGELWDKPATNVCTLGHAKHADCECSKFTLEAQGLDENEDCRECVA
jgi:hypothetical protein